MKNLEIKKKSKKLNHIKVRPFFIKLRKKIISYKLELYKKAKIYLIFYILLLKFVDSEIF